VRQEFNKQSDQVNAIYTEPRCQEGNYGMAGLLAGAGAVEAAFAEGRGPDPATTCTSGCGVDPEVDDPFLGRLDIAIGVFLEEESP
jgi:hypothetical protein